jgi:hypothetical protein
MSVKNAEKVLERMAVGDDVILTVKRDLDGKMRATAMTWPDAKVNRARRSASPQCGDQVRVARKARYHGRALLTRMDRPRTKRRSSSMTPDSAKARYHDDWDVPIEPYDPYGAGRRRHR